MGFHMKSFNVSLRLKVGLKEISRTLWICLFAKDDGSRLLESRCSFFQQIFAMGCTNSVDIAVEQKIESKLRSSEVFVANDDAHKKSKTTSSKL